MKLVPFESSPRDDSNGTKIIQFGPLDQVLDKFLEKNCVMLEGTSPYILQNRYILGDPPLKHNVIYGCPLYVFYYLIKIRVRVS